MQKNIKITEHCTHKKLVLRARLLNRINSATMCTQHNMSYFLFGNIYMHKFLHLHVHCGHGLNMTNIFVKGLPALRKYTWKCSRHPNHVQRTLDMIFPWMTKLFGLKRTNIWNTIRTIHRRSPMNSTIHIHGNCFYQFFTWLFVSRNYIQ